MLKLLSYIILVTILIKKTDKPRGPRKCGDGLGPGYMQFASKKTTVLLPGIK